MAGSKNIRKSDSDGELRGSWATVLGSVLILLAFFPTLSLLSYNWQDVSWLYTPANNPPDNLIGVSGAWGTFLGYSIFGLGFWLAPAWLLLFGLLLFLQRLGRPWRKVAWAFVFQVAVSSLFEFVNDGEPIEWLNIKSAGGAIGFFFNTFIFQPLLGSVGATLVFVAVMLVSIIFGVGIRNWADFFEYMRVAAEERRLRHADEEERIRFEQERLDREEEKVRRKREKEERAAERERIREERQRERDERQRQREEERKAREEAKAAHEREVAAERERIAREERERLERARAEEQARNREAEQKADAADDGANATGASDDSAAGAPAYELPTVDLLEPIESGEAEYGDIEQCKSELIGTLHQFGIDVDITGVERGPVVTTFELLPAPGIRPERIASMNKTLEMRLHATSIRIEAPIPGKGVVGVEIPNKKACAVTVREVLEGETWKRAVATMHLPMLLGKDSSGHDLVVDLASMPHVLVAGATGSGKSVCVNSILTGWLMSRKPDELKLMLVDPKVVEFSGYRALPHLVVPIVTDPKKVSLGLIWAIHEMEKRYKTLARVGVKNIDSYNKRATQVQGDLFAEQDGRPPEPRLEKMPYIVIVIDELADLMIQVGHEIEDSISRLAAKARAVGIHLVLATQRPTVDVVTGTIKANIPGRIAFQVAQKNDSRTILDRMGAESLIGKGDMLFLNPRTSKTVRAQGSFITDDDAEHVADFIRNQGPPSYMREVVDSLENPVEEQPSSSKGGHGVAAGTADGMRDDELYKPALDLIRRTHRASTSSIQRQFGIGYTRAARLIDMMEERGILGPPNGANPREILIDLDAEVPDMDGASEVDAADDDLNEDRSDDAYGEAGSEQEG